MGLEIHSLHFASGKAIPDGTEATIRNNGDGTVAVDLRLPGQNQPRTFKRLPIVDSQVHIPVELVFLCHAKEDKAHVQALGDRLNADGIMTWFDEKDLLPGDHWKSEIKKAITGSDYVLVFLSPRSVRKTGYVQQEVRLVLEERNRRPLGARFIIPALIEACDVPQEFEDIHFLQLWDEGEYDRLKKQLSRPV